MEVFLLVGLILLNGLFAMSEIGLVTARRGRLARFADEGDASAVVALRLGEDPTRFLSTIQIGITSIGILNGIVGDAVLAEPFADWMQTVGMERHASHILATALVVVAITYVSIVVGELVPKRLAQMYPEGIARAVARPMELLAMLARPFVMLLTSSTDSILRLLGKENGAASAVTEEEIHALLAEGSEAGVIEHSEHQMVRNVFRLDERQIGSLMIPRGEIVYLDANVDIQENLRRAIESEHSRFPVSRGGLDHVLGIITAKQLLARTLQGRLTDLTKDLYPNVFVPETLTGMALLEHFRGSGAHMVLVVDEYGVIQGLVTLQDVLEAVTGEFKSLNQEDSWAVQREDGSWLLDGLIPIPELKDRLNLTEVPDENRGRYHTLSGLMMWLLGRLPQTADVATWQQWRLEVVDLDGKRVDKVLATKVPDKAENGKGSSKESA